ncbi:hypothetical protein C1645_831067 [Glomus cerebriforme]|uniref:Uncharacterized protein n=1 Tax=Glomus cerebriforme TaxID=658196 RepID=A0A397SKS6_9GLOM|nr:hypothetical protein C1645_831067 [Glomus cerebriforme]
MYSTPMVQMTNQQVLNQSQQQPPQVQQQYQNQYRPTSYYTYYHKPQSFCEFMKTYQTQTRTLLNHYVYDFLKRSGATKTARTYLQEVKIKLKYDEKDGQLPDAEVPTQTPNGFLYDWWMAFWDLYHARENLGPEQYTDYVRRGGNRFMPLYYMPMVYKIVIAQQQQEKQIQLQKLKAQQQQSLPRQSQKQTPQQQSQQSQQPQQTPQQHQPLANYQQVTHQQPHQPQPQPSPAHRQQIAHKQPHQPQSQPSPAHPQQIAHRQLHQQNQQNNSQMIDANTNLQLKVLGTEKTSPGLQQRQQHRHINQTHQNIAQIVHAQSQNSQPIQNQVQHQNPQQQGFRVHITPNQVHEQLNSGTKRGVEIEDQTNNRNVNQQATSPNKRQRISYVTQINQGQQQQLPNQYIGDPYDMNFQQGINPSRSITEQNKLNKQNAAKTMPTQSQLQAPSDNQSNAISIPQQPIQSQQSDQSTATTSLSQDVPLSSLNTSMDEMMNYFAGLTQFNMTDASIFDFNDITDLDYSLS